MKTKVLTLKLPQTLSFWDYHDAQDLKDTLKSLGLKVKIQELPKLFDGMYWFEIY